MDLYLSMYLYRSRSGTNGDFNKIIKCEMGVVVSYSTDLRDERVGLKDLSLNFVKTV